MSDWMILRQLDPDLPSRAAASGLGRDRTRARSSRRSTTHSGRWGSCRFREIVNEIAPDLGDLATHHTSTNMVPIELPPQTPARRRRGSDALEAVPQP